MKSLTILTLTTLISVLCACSPHNSTADWTPVITGPPRPAISQNEVLIMDEYPLAEYTHIGYFSSPDGQIVRVSLENTELINYFTKEAAAMGGNTVIIRDPRIRYRSGEGKSTRVDVIYMREEMGTHGEEDLGDALPIDEDTLRIY
ncbi:MAG: hypothetical protein Q4C05_06725 [Akkermansia sp.]|nr:hypothetical protein [Akkermansia sp.]